MKQTLPLYNFLPRVSSGGTPHFPYLSDSEMGNLRWVAESYSNELPVYVPDSGRLLKGDRVRITSGYFAGMEAEVVIQPGGGHKDVMARILDCMWVPLLEVKPGEYELIELNTNGKHVYTHLDNDRLRDGLHDALGRYHASGSVGEEDTRLAREVLRACLSAINAENQQIIKQTPNFTPKNVKLGVFILFKTNHIRSENNLIKNRTNEKNNQFIFRKISYLCSK